MRNVAEEVGFAISVNVFNINNLTSSRLQMLPKMLPKKRPDLKEIRPGRGCNWRGRAPVARGKLLKSFCGSFFPSSLLVRSFHQARDWLWAKRLSVPTKERANTFLLLL